MRINSVSSFVFVPLHRRKEYVGLGVTSISSFVDNVTDKLHIPDDKKGGKSDGGRKDAKDAKHGGGGGGSGDK